MDKLRHNEDLLGHPFFTSFPHQKASCDNTNTRQIQVWFLSHADPQSNLILLIKHRYAAPYEKASLTKTNLVK